MESKTNESEIVKATSSINKVCNSGLYGSKRDKTSVSYIIEKSSRIASVAFILANVLDKTNPLKSEILKCSIRLVKDSSKSLYSHESRSALQDALVELTSLLEVGKITEQFSKMNVDVITDDIFVFSELLRKIEWREGRRYIDQSIFRVDVPESILGKEEVPIRSETVIRQDKEPYYPRPRVVEHMSDRYVERVEKDNTDKVQNQYKERVQEVQKDRRAIILSLIQKKDKINVRDVASVIKDCSEKTLQRELLALVRQGVLKKEGERRWSTYRLV